MFEHTIAERKVHFNLLQKVNLLQNLCIKTVSNHLDYYCGKVDPFSCLSPSILMLLKESLGKDNYGIPEVVLSFITAHSKKLSIRLCGQSPRSRLNPVWTRDNVDLIFELISQKCEFPEFKI